MAHYFCLQPKEDNKPQNTGSRYVFNNKDKWVSGDKVADYLTVGFTKGIDHVYYKNKTYSLYKVFMEPDSGNVIFLCLESIQGCDLSN